MKTDCEVYRPENIHEAKRAKRIEEHLSRLVKMWNTWHEGEIDLDVDGFSEEFGAAEKSLKQI